MSDIDRHMRRKDKPNNLSLNLKPCLKLNSSEKGLNKYVFWLHKELTDLRAEMLRQPDSECPNGFEENHGRLPNFTIPDADSIMRQVRYIKLGNGPVPFALGTLGQENDPVFQHDLFTAPSYIHGTPTEPLPMWLIDAISGKSASYHQALELARSTDDWGLAAEIARYHEADTCVLNIVAEIHALDCKLQVVKVASHQSRSRLEGACHRRRSDND